MSGAGAWWQYAVLGPILLASALRVFRSLAPRLTIRAQARASAALSRRRRPGALRRIGRWLQPREATGNCGDGCGTCGSCASGAAAGAHPEQPVTFQARPRRDEMQRWT